MKKSLQLQLQLQESLLSLLHTMTHKQQNKIIMGTILTTLIHIAMLTIDAEGNYHYTWKVTGSRCVNTSYNYNSYNTTTMVTITIATTITTVITTITTTINQTRNHKEQLNRLVV